MESSFKAIFPTQPQRADKEIGSFYMEALRDSQLNLHPDYNRFPCWNLAQKSYLIDSIMNNVPLHNFLLYKFKKTNECLDGQNRLLTIREYIEQTPDDDMFFWIINIKCQTPEGEKIVRQELVYYSQTEEFKAWTEAQAEAPTKSRKKDFIPKTYRPMTEDERESFSRYNLVVQTITTELSMEARQDLFNRWQNGSAISGCDRFINNHAMFCELVLSKGLKDTHVRQLCEHLKCRKSNWLWDLYRILLVFINPENPFEFAAISSQDTRIQIKEPKEKYKITEEQYNSALGVLDNFLAKFEFLRHDSEGPKRIKSIKDQLYFSLLVSLAYIWFTCPPAMRLRLENAEQTTAKIKSLLDNKEIVKNTLNNLPHVKALIANFPAIKEVLERAPEPEPAIAVAQPIKIGKAQRHLVWDHYIGTAIGTTKCVCCNINDIKMTQFECGHVEARAKGGEDTLENLRPICQTCNREMKTKNMRDYMIEMGYSTQKAFPPS
jgi:hypothetical protein